MSRKLVLLSIVLCTACFRDRKDEDTADPEAELETAVRALSEATSMKNFASEVGQAATSDEDSDTSSLMAMDEDDCPYITVGEGTVTVDYGEGCVPDSGIIFGEVSGAFTASVDRDERAASASFESMGWMGYGIDGTMAVDFDRQPGIGVDLTEQVDMTFTDGGVTLSLVEEVAVTLRYTYMVVDGHIDYDAGYDSFDIEADEVQWDYDNLTLTCPLPSSGTMRVQWEIFDVLFTFDDNSPQTGEVQVESTRNEGTFNICAWWYGL